MIGPQLEFSDQLHALKYRNPGEDFREAVGRFTSAMSDDEEHFQALRDIHLGMRFLPGGRVQAAMGSTKNVTAHNCYASGTIEDSFIEGHGSIMKRATQAAATMRMGGGIGYDFSTLRPRGALIKKLQSQSSGPVSFMGIYDAVCQCVSSSGHRRGAQMGTLRIDHPDIEEFIHCKQNHDKLLGFNISVAVTDEFMECLTEGKPFMLRWGGENYNEIDPNAIWNQLMRSTWDWAEPGVLFIDTINRMNNLSYCERIYTTNPCGEQPLPPYGACLLGSVNLVKYLHRQGQESWGFDWDQFGEDIPHIVRGMDNVIDRAIYPLYEQEKEAKAKRRMGLGVTGLANCIEAMGFAYGSPDFIFYVNAIMSRLTNEAYAASALLAKEKGVFPLFEKSSYLSAPFISERPSHVRNLIGQHGIRNSHLISIAPTGTISMVADNVSSGAEPVFAYETQRTIIEFDGPREVVLEDYGSRVLGIRGRVASEVTVEEHLAVLAAASQHVDSAVSKTCNVGDEVTFSQFKQIYLDAWKAGCKGCTTFRAAGKRGGVLVAQKEKSVDEAEAACRVDLETGRRECE